MGNLIRTFGDGWEEAVPGKHTMAAAETCMACELWCFCVCTAVLRDDMGSLMEEGSGDGARRDEGTGTAEPLSMQHRVIQLGLDSVA